MLAHAFQFVGRVIFVVGPENFRSQKALEKIGAVRAYARLDPRGGDSLVYEITANDFPACCRESDQEI